MEFLDDFPEEFEEGKDNLAGFGALVIFLILLGLGLFHIYTN